MNPADWMNMTPADWLDMATSAWPGAAEWSAMTPADWLDRTYGQWGGTSPTEWLGAMYGQPGAGRPAAHRTGRAHRPHARHCGCDDCRAHGRDRCPRCGTEPCECYCCIGDVDLAVYTRVAERRVVPIVVENERRRDTHITLDLSNWTTRGGKEAPVRTGAITPTEFDLGPCAREQVTLVVEVTGEVPQRDEKNQDVDECVVAYADLRLEGCDHRPLRLAVAVLPRDCDPFTVGCGCTCC
jgi:hypothetical protein